MIRRPPRSTLFSSSAASDVDKGQKLLGASDVAFIGGSLEPVGGHNMLEALAMGTPAITGPHVINFQVVADLLTELEVLSTVTTPLGLGQTALSMLQNTDCREKLAAKGLQVVDENRGAMGRLLDIIRGYLPDNH